jgi:tRNA nucleotidyltransferase (CCA-adding enzyme)
VYLLGLLACRQAAEARSLLRRLALPPRLAGRLGKDLGRLRTLTRLFRQARDLPPSRVYRWLAEASLEATLALMARMERVELRRAIGNFLTTGRGTQPHLRGGDLRALGFLPGPIYRDILNSLRYARLDGEVQSRDDELRFVRQRFGHLLPSGEGRAERRGECA